MTASRDDMVITPSVEGTKKSVTGIDERQEKRIAGSSRRRQRRLGRNISTTRAARRARGRIAASNSRAAGGARALGAFGRAAGVTGALGALAIIITIAGRRALGGGNMEATMTRLKKDLYGSHHTNAIGNKKALQAIMSHPYLLDVIGSEGSTAAAAPLFELRSRRSAGAARGFEELKTYEEFTQSNELEIVVDRITEWFRKQFFPEIREPLKEFQRKRKNRKK